jgi:hypothetical protein
MKPDIDIDTEQLQDIADGIDATAHHLRRQAKRADSRKVRVTILSGVRALQGAANSLRVIAQAIALGEAVSEMLIRKQCAEPGCRRIQGHRGSHWRADVGFHRGTHGEE